MQIAESVFERWGQAMKLYLANIGPLIVAYLVVVGIYEIIFMPLMKYFMLSGLSDSPLTEGNLMLGLSPMVGVGLIFGFLAFIIFTFAMIPLMLATIRGAKQMLSGDELKQSENISFGAKHLFESLRTYWYLFVYVALFPAIGIIIGLLFILAGISMGEQSGVIMLGYGILSISGIALFVSLIYRGLRSTFALYNATDKIEYNKENFQASVELTKDQWWRIAGNFIILMISMGIFGFIVGLIGSFIGYGQSQSIGVVLEQIMAGDYNPESIRATLEGMSKVGTYDFIDGAFNTLIQSFATVFGIIFTYLLFRRLEQEKNPSISNVSETKSQVRSDTVKNGVIEEL